MIPISLTLKNFTSYGENVPPLDFTRFHLACLSGPNGAGKSSILDAITYALWGESRGKLSPDDLIKLGEEHMEVEFEFELDKMVFKVVRVRNKKRGSTDFSLWSRKKENSNWINLTEGTIKDTQYKVDEILKTSFETFSNSAFLRQGKADEFTLKGPTDRKRILSEILGLQLYEELEERAKEKTKRTGQEIVYRETQIGEIENELGQAEIKKDQLKAAEEKVSVLEEKIKTIEEQIQELNIRKESLFIEKANREQLEKSIFRRKKELNEKIIQKEKKEKQITELKMTLENKDEIQQKYQRKITLQKENEHLSETQYHLMSLMKQKAELEFKLKELKSHHEKEITRLEEQCRTLEKEGVKINEDIQKMQTIKQTCPLCGSALDEAHQKDVIGKLTHQRDEKRNEYIECKGKIAALSAKKFESDEIFTIQKEIDESQYDEALHRKIKSELIQLTDIEQKKALLDTSEATLKSELENYTLLKETIQQEESSLKEEQDIYEKMQDVSLTLKETQDKIETGTFQQKNLQSEERQARAILGEARGLVSRFEQLENLRTQKITERDALSNEKGAYEELALAFGKKGIQAMLIETAIPEIEEETNRLLDKLTDGRMRVTLQTQKDTKKGDTVETLEIILSDELGSRPYEMYSGGEAFRVNFALRLSLSKLLTHRAGTKLQFLVIDEGFGTQDAHGREKLIEAIAEIKDDFEKILVVTHIEELKEMFPVRIEVEKRAGGSTFQMVGV